MSKNIRLSQLEDHFSALKDKPDNLKLSEGETVLNFEKFIETHLYILKSNAGNKRFMPYYQRLLIAYHKTKKDN